MAKADQAWGALVEAVSILQMTARYTQSTHVPEEQYMRFREIVKRVAEDETASGAAREIADHLYDICPHGEVKEQNCERCLNEAFSYV